MYFCYLIISLLQLYLSRRRFKKLVNPVSIYIVVWNAVAFLYELNLVYFNELTLFAWITIIIFQTIFFVTCSLGNNISIKQTKNIDFDRGVIFKTIIVLSVISAFGIIPNFINFVHRYSWNFMDNMNSIYIDRLTNSRGYELIPYVGSLAYMAVIFSGVYCRRYGFDKKLLIPISLSILDTLPGGGRSGIVLIFLFFTMPRVLFGTNFNTIPQKKSVSNRKKILGLVIAMILIILFWKMSSVRSRWINVNNYMSPQMVKMVSINPVFYKTYIYIVAPLVALSEYLKKMSFNFGINTFGFFINILNKFGFGLYYERYQTSLYTPLECNVATYIRELIQDFTFFGALIGVGLIGIIFGINYRNVRTKNSYFCETMSGILGTVVVMSFYMFYLRESIFWIIILLLPIVIKLMSFAQCLQKNKEVHNDNC